MKGLRILIDTQNAAFGEYWDLELARIFRVLSDQLEHGHIPEKLLDSNGNTVGYIHVEEAEAEKPVTPQVESDSLDNYEAAFPRSPISFRG